MLIALREGYDLARFRADALAGLTVAIVALTLAMALGIASGASPDKGLITAIVGASALVALAQLPVETVGDRFPDMATTLPAPHIPAFSLAMLREVMPSAFTIAFLAGIEALLSDGMTGFKHRPGQELVGQGVANLASALFGGLPATGALSRTATNVRAGA